MIRTAAPNIVIAMEEDNSLADPNSSSASSSTSDDIQPQVRDQVNKQTLGRSIFRPAVNVMM
jgi:hypothetical protein